jgi:hypothetical protein
MDAKPVFRFSLGAATVAIGLTTLKARLSGFPTVEVSPMAPEANLFVTDEMRREFQEAMPFPHIILDSFLDTAALTEAERELRTMPRSKWFTHHDPKFFTGDIGEVQKRKFGLQDPSVLPPRVRDVMTFFSSPEMCRFFEELTGIADLQSDPEFVGGGVHNTEPGGKLSIHADFNLHPTTGKHRRVNALLYLNNNWKEDFAGALELWDRDVERCVRTVAPIFNRLVVFRITDDAFHGNPEPWNGPPGYNRLSFAFYYYTDDRPNEEKSPFHWATWKSRPNRGW